MQNQVIVLQNTANPAEVTTYHFRAGGRTGWAFDSIGYDTLYRTALCTDLAAEITARLQTTWVALGAIPT